MRKPPTVIYTLSLHDALPISELRDRGIRQHALQVPLLQRDGGREQGREGPDSGDGRAAERRQREQHVAARRSEEHTSELQSLTNLVCRLLLEKKNTSSHPVME